MRESFVCLKTRLMRPKLPGYSPLLLSTHRGASALAAASSKWRIDILCTVPYSKNGKDDLSLLALTRV